MTDSHEEHSLDLAPLKATTLREQARQAIRASILTGQVRSGEIFSVSDFAAQLGVSATPVREALFDLANEGLVEAIRKRGFRIPVLSSRELIELLEVRILLEVPSMGKVVDLLEPEDLAEFRKIVSSIDDAAESGDLNEYLKWDRRFHLALIERLGNQRLSGIVRQLRDQSRMYRFYQEYSENPLPKLAKEHHEILNALEHGNRTKVEQITQQHLEHSFDDISVADQSSE